MAPRADVQALFDGYAGQFAQHVVPLLHHRAHEVLARPLGTLPCFSTKVAGPQTQGFELLPSLRYVHAEAYLRELAGQHGFEVVKLSQEPIREDQRRAIDGVFVYLVRC